MAVKTFEREVKQLSTEFTNLIENYNFEEYDFHSIRQTLQDYIEQTYPNYNDYFRSDYVMMLIELFAFYGEMMAYRMDTNMNEVYLSSAKERKNIIKIADMLGYKYARIKPSISILKIDLSNGASGAQILNKVKNVGSVNDILSKTNDITFIPIEFTVSRYFQYKLDYLLKNVTAEDFMNTLDNIFDKLSDFKETENIKVKRIVEDNFEYFERSIFIDKFQMRYKPNTNIYPEYMGQDKPFELQSLLFDSVTYFNSENTEDALSYNEDALYAPFNEVGFEFTLRYDKGYNILDKNVFMYIPAIQGGTFTRPIEVTKSIKNFKMISYEENIFNDKTLVRQYDAQDNLLRTYYEVDNLNNHTHKYAYEVNNTPDGHIELLFGDGKNSEILLPAAKTLLFYRKNFNNSDEIMNVVNAKMPAISLDVEYYDSYIEQTQISSLSLDVMDRFSAKDGMSAESDEQIKYMARKLRSIQDRFVTASDYETAGMLHPRVKYSTVILRSYIGKNSARMTNEFIDIFFNIEKMDISVFKLVEDGFDDEIFIITPTAYFTEPSVADKFDSIKFIENSKEYYFEIFDIDSIPANLWYRYPSEFTERKSKGTIIKLINKKVNENDILSIINENTLNNILMFDYSIKNIVFKSNTNKYLYFIFDAMPKDDLENYLDDNKVNILLSLNKLFDDIDIVDINLTSIDTLYSMTLLYKTKNIYLPEINLSYVWTHYKSDDIFINPSKSNIVEIYVTAIKKDLKKNIDLYEPLTSSEINNLINNINQRKMISDIVQVYNSNIFEIEIAMKIFKSHTFSITNELLKSKIDVVIDSFFDISNIPLGKHFYLSRLIEWIHSNVEEVQHIEMIDNDNGEQITPSSTLDILKDKIVFTQIVEKHKIINNTRKPSRTIDIVS